MYELIQNAETIFELMMLNKSDMNDTFETRK